MRRDKFVSERARGYSKQGDSRNEMRGGSPWIPLLPGAEQHGLWIPGGSEFQYQFHHLPAI